MIDLNFAADGASVAINPKHIIAIQTADWNDSKTGKSHPGSWIHCIGNEQYSVRQTVPEVVEMIHNPEVTFYGNKESE